jgi:type I restriction enzyme S subunit
MSDQLGQLVKFLSGFAFDSEKFNSDGNGIPIVRIRDVSRGRTTTFYDGPFDDRFLLMDGDSLVGMDGEFNLARWRGGAALLNQRVLKIDQVADEVDRRYLDHFLARELKKIEAETPWVTVKHLSTKTLNGLEVSFPPLAEQRRIAGILDRADDLRAKRQAAIDKLESLTQAIFQDMFGEPIRPNAQAGSTLLSELITKSQGSVDPSGFPNEEFDLYSVPAYDRGEPEVLRGDEIGSSKQVVREGDVLLSRIVPHIRRAWVVSEFRGRRMIASGEWIVFRSESFEPEFLRQLFLSDQFNARLMNCVAGVGGSLMRARPQAVGRISTASADLNEQKVFSSVVAEAERVRGQYEKALRGSAEMRESLQQQAFSGAF